MISAATGTSREIAGALRNAVGLRAVYVVMGPYSLVAMVEGEDLQDIADIVTTQIHAVPGVDRTVTLLAVEVARPDVQVLPPPD